MRETEIVHDRRRRWALALTLLGLTGACKAEPSPSSASDGQAPTPSPRPGADAAEAGARASGSEPAPPPELAELAEPDPERAAKLADLDALCKALDHDYIDGTLTDYYRDVKPQTAWGKAQREAGDAAMRPGRLLEQAVAELDPAGDDPALGNCRKLLDYLDDVE